MTSASAGEPPLLRIGELARRAGIPAATLRAWERRYGIVVPRRNESGYRLYTAEDQLRLSEMSALIAAGMAPAEAARTVLDGSGPASGGSPHPPSPAVATASTGDLGERLYEALLGFDDVVADRLIDRALGAYSTEALVGELILPVLRRIGEGWTGGGVNIGQEHFASNLLRGRLLGLARGWGAGDGRLALLACPPGELHDIGLICFGMVLRSAGWRIAFLGADTPISSIEAAAEQLDPAAIVLCTMAPERLATHRSDLGGLASRRRVLAAGSGASSRLCTDLGIGCLLEDPVAAAAVLAGSGARRLDGANLQR